MVGDYVFNITQFDATIPIASGIPYLNPNRVNFENPTSSDTGQSDTDNITNANTIYLSVEHPNINPESDEIIFTEVTIYFLENVYQDQNLIQILEYVPLIIPIYLKGNIKFIQKY